MRHHAFVLVVLLVLGLAGRTLAGEATFKVIVNPKNRVDRVEREFLRNAWLMKEAEWGDGETIRPIDLSSKFAVRDQFTREVIKKTPAQLRSYWSQQVFSGKGVPPPEAEATDEVIAYVLANRGAVAYIPADADARGAKVVEVR